MSLYEGFFGAKRKSAAASDGPEHFKVRPLAEHIFDEYEYEEGPVGTRMAQPVNPHANPSWIETIADSVSDTAVNANYSTMPAAPTSIPAPAQQSVVNVPMPMRSRGAGQQLQPVHVPASTPVHQSVPSGMVSTVWNESYDRSLGNIQDHVHAVAGAVAMLDAVEHKMIAIKCELTRIRETGLAIDSDKVLMALQSLSDYVNQAISSVDDQCVNMLRDAKLEIRFAELETLGNRPDGVKLTMISVERLLDYKIKSAMTEGLVAEETPEFVDDICAIISSNIQVLTSVMLALFASRDYTQAVTKLASRESIIPSIKEEAVPQITSATIDRLQFDNLDQGDGQEQQLQEGRASLAELLKSVRDNRNGASAPFN